MKVRKRIITLIIIVLLLTAAVFSSLYYQVSKTVAVKASMFDVSEQLANGNNWLKWNPLLSNASSKALIANNTIRQVITLPNGTLLKISVANPANFNTEQNISGSKVSQVINIHPANLYGYTDVQWTKKQRGYLWLADKISGKNMVSEQLKSLKRYVENPAHLYGFQIKLSGVTDTLICTKKQYISPGKTRPYVRAMVLDMRRYLEKNKINFNKAYYYVSYSTQANGKVELAVGIPVNAEAAVKDGYEFLKLPANGQILTGTYEGPYSALRKLYNAMDKYAMDKRLTKVAQPMEKYPTDAGNIGGDAPVKMQIIYPVY